MKKLLRSIAFLLGIFLVAFGLVACHDGGIPLGGIACAESDADPRVTRILVMGCDRAAGLCDSMFVLSLDEANSRASLLQIPRDTYAEYTERDYKKLNGARGVLGSDGVCRFLSRALGVRLDHYVVMELACVQQIVDAVGGVDMELPEALRYSDPEGGLDIDLPRGAIHLDGKRAEQLIRYRSGYANADLGRLDAQKRFMQAFLCRCSELGVGELLRITPIMFRSVQTDMELTRAIGLVGVLHTCMDEDLPMATLAGTAAQGNSGAWYYVLNREAARRMINEYCFTSLNEADFDPDGVFDREGHADFHKLYTAPDSFARG